MYELIHLAHADELFTPIAAAQLGVLACTSTIFALRFRQARVELRALLDRVAQVQGRAVFTLSYQQLDAFAMTLPTLSRSWRAFTGSLFAPPPLSADATMRTTTKPDTHFTSARIVADAIGAGWLRFSLSVHLIIAFASILACVAATLLGLKQGGLAIVGVVAVGAAVAILDRGIKLVAERVVSRDLSKLAKMLEQSLRVLAPAEQLDLIGLELQTQSMILSLVERKVGEALGLGEAPALAPTKRRGAAADDGKAVRTAQTAVDDLAAIIVDAGQDLQVDFQRTFTQLAEAFGRKAARMGDGKTPVVRGKVHGGGGAGRAPDASTAMSEFDYLKTAFPESTPHMREIIAFLETADGYVKAVSNTGRLFAKLREERLTGEKTSHIEASQVLAEIRAAVARINQDRAKLDSVWTRYTATYRGLANQARAEMKSSHATLTDYRSRISVCTVDINATMSNRLADLTRAIETSA